jgi:acetyl esterase/lipase
MRRNILRRGRLLAALAASEPAGAGAFAHGIGERLARLRAELGDDLFDASTREITLPAGVRVEHDIAYGPSPAQRLDVYLPASAADGGAPVILFLHGGGWRRGDKGMAQMVANKAPHWLGKGFVFASANYRMLPDADVVQQADDAARALAFVQARASGWGGDPARVVLVGHSAGAHLAALVTADPSIATRQGARPWLATIALDSAALDMVAIMNRPHYRFYDPVFGTDPAFWREASPTHRMTGKPAAPMLLVCSSRRSDACQPAWEFAEKARAFGGEATVLPVDLGHLQINDQLGAPGAYTEAVDAFLRTLGLP